MRLRAGIDLGGTKIELLVLDGHGTACHRERVPTPQGDYRATVDAIAALVARAEALLGATVSVGVGHPGSRSPLSGLIRNANSTCLNGHALEDDLCRALAREVRLTNDADCFALSEASDGAGAGARSVFGVILGTGVGGGLVIDGRLLVGANGIAGEWGHNRLDVAAIDGDPWAPACYCGRTGCVETWLSGPALAADFARHSGRQLDAAAIVAAADGGDIAAAAALARYTRRLAAALAAVINLVDPEVIVLGGGLSRIGQLYPGLAAALPPFVFSDCLRTRLQPPRHGDASGARGAAWLWPAAA
jgi:predicted NBD/HSP70 family sugar kinase